MTDDAPHVGSCGKCRFWSYLGRDGVRTLGSCHANPPQAVERATRIIWVFPEVPSTGWCGKFMAQREPQKPPKPERDLRP